MRRDSSERSISTLTKHRLQGARCLVTDTGANGLRARDDQVDMFDDGAGPVRFNGNWFGQQMSEADYARMSAEADTQYERMLRVLIANAQ